MRQFQHWTENSENHWHPSEGYLNVYDTAQHWGGAEEGGWWYDWHECILSIPCQREQAPYLTRVLQWTGNYDSYGNIHTTKGGRLVTFAFEKDQAQSASKERPHYE